MGMEVLVSQLERMLSGRLYQANDRELVAARARAQALVEAYNGTSSTEPARRRALLEQLLGGLGEGVTVLPRLACDYGFNVRVGSRVFVNYDCVLLDCAPITLGDDVQLGPRVQLYTAEHPVEPTLRRSGAEYALPIVVGDNAWIGGGAIVCAGVTIGRDAVVGAGSVVTRDVPEGVLAVGNPCRVVRDVRSGERPHRARSD